MAYHLSGTIAVPPNARERVRRALPEHVRLTLAEPGCRSFVVEERADGVFEVREAFDDESAFHAHQQRIRGTAWEAASATATRNYKTWTD